MELVRALYFAESSSEKTNNKIIVMPRKNYFNKLKSLQDNEIINAKSKINKKNLDAIVLNSLIDKGAGFGHDTNKISYINSSGLIKKFKLKSKDKVSVDIFIEIINDFYEKI